MEGWGSELGQRVLPIYSRGYCPRHHGYRLLANFSRSSATSEGDQPRLRAPVQNPLSLGFELDGLAQIL
jgi:hypothetical protein